MAGKFLRFLRCEGEGEVEGETPEREVEGKAVGDLFFFLRRFFGLASWEARNTKSDGRTDADAA